MGDLSTEQRTPDVSGADVERVVRRDFPAADYASVLRVLDKYGSKTKEERSAARVQLAVLKLALGDMNELRRHIVAAETDYRDVLAAAEYPLAAIRGSAFTTLSEKERQNIYESDWGQYQQWLQHR
jgi:hypothetical protein